MRSSTVLAILLACAALAAPVASQAGAASAYTYTYSGPQFTGGTAHLAIALTVPAKLTPSTTYSGLPPGTTGATITVTTNTGATVFSVPLQTFAVSTDSAGNIASWFLFSDSNNLTTTFPAVGTDHQAYSINTLSTTVPIPGGVTGHYAYDQATIIIDYASCVGVSGCQLAGNGQPYVEPFAGIVNPASGTWKVTSRHHTGEDGGAN